MMYPGRRIVRLLGNRQGMTLLEILFALLILGIVVSMVSVSLSGSLDLLNANLDRGEIYHRAQVAMQRITEDLASAVFDENDENLNFIGQDEGTDGEAANIIQFPSTAHVVFNRQVDNPGLTLIGYSVEPDEQREGELLLVRSDQLIVALNPDEALPAAPEGLVLSDGLKSVSFRYFDIEGEEYETWTTDKDSLLAGADRRLPVAVACTLEYWLDIEQDTSIEFTTRVLLPVGLIQAQNDANASP